jgi:hypothetical protein
MHVAEIAGLTQMQLDRMAKQPGDLDEGAK